MMMKTGTRKQQSPEKVQPAKTEEVTALLESVLAQKAKIKDQNQNAQNCLFLYELFVSSRTFWRKNVHSK